MIQTKNTESETLKNVKVKDAAKEMGKSLQYIRVGLQRKLFDFGVAQIMPGKDNYTYYINPRKFYAYIGKELPTEYREQEEQEKTTGTEKYKIITDPAVARKITWR